MRSLLVFYITLFTFIHAQMYLFCAAKYSQFSEDLITETFFKSCSEIAASELEEEEEENANSLNIDFTYSQAAIIKIINKTNPISKSHSRLTSAPLDKEKPPPKYV